MQGWFRIRAVPDMAFRRVGFLSLGNSFAYAFPDTECETEEEALDLVNRLRRGHRAPE